MAKSGVQYAADVRELRAQGVDFPSASGGYILADAANWSSGQKAAVTRAINQFDFTAFDRQQAAQEKAAAKRCSIAAKKGAATRARKAKPRAVPPPPPRAVPPPAPRAEPAPAPPDIGLTGEEIEGFFEDAAGDDEEEYDDIDFFDFDEAEDLIDEENDTYDETPS